MLQHEELVWATNKDDHPIELSWNSKRTVIEPNKRKTVQLEAITNVAGDPRSVEHSQRIWLDDQHTEDLMIPSRPDEVIRLRHRYAIGEGDVRSFNDKEGNRAPNLPQLEVHNDEGERIWTVLDDPEGIHSTALGIPDVSNENLASEIERMQRQLDLMREQAAEGETHTPLDEDELPAVDDAGARAPRKQRHVPDSLKQAGLPVEPA